MYNKLDHITLKRCQKWSLSFSSIAPRPRMKKFLLDCLCDSLWSYSRWNKPKSHGKLLQNERTYIIKIIMWLNWNITLDRQVQSLGDHGDGAPRCGGWLRLHRHGIGNGNKCLRLL